MIGEQILFTIEKILDTTSVVELVILELELYQQQVRFLLKMVTQQFTLEIITIVLR